MSLDKAIVGGRVVFPGHGTFEVSLGIRNGKIAAIVPWSESLAADRIIDAAGRVVIPGVVESHSHLCTGNGYEDLTAETRSAIVGGVTTVLFFLRDPNPYDEMFQSSRSEGEARSFIDFGMHVVLMTEEHLRSIPKYLHEYGITSFKFYMTYRGRDARMVGFDGTLKPFDGVTDGFFYACMEELAQHPKALMMVHAENIELIHHLQRKYQSQDRQDMNAYQASRPVLAEVEAVQRCAVFARETGAKVLLLHLTTAQSLETVHRFREAGANLFAEVCHPYLVLHDDGGLGREAKLRPPIRPLEHKNALWERIHRGDVDVVSSDHVPRKLAAKLGDLWSLAAGAAGTPTMLPVLIEEGFYGRGIPLHELIDLVTARPAQLYQLYPNKGVLQVGSDADIAIIDVDTPREVDAAQLGSFSDFSLYQGRALRGWPTHVFVRGRCVMDDGVIDEKAGGWGQYLARS